MAGTVRMAIGLGFISLGLWYFFSLSLGLLQQQQPWQIGLSLFWSIVGIILFYWGYTASRKEYQTTQPMGW